MQIVPIMLWKSRSSLLVRAQISIHRMQFFTSKSVNRVQNRNMFIPKHFQIHVKVVPKHTVESFLVVLNKNMFYEWLYFNEKWIVNISKCLWMLDSTPLILYQLSQPYSFPYIHPQICRQILVQFPDLMHMPLWPPFNRLTWEWPTRSCLSLANSGRSPSVAHTACFASSSTHGKGHFHPPRSNTLSDYMAVQNMLDKCYSYIIVLFKVLVCIIFRVERLFFGVAGGC